mmetsp:Transcript_12743/g.32645  ORF Transcript_12743/g.32645 Transcript_12743/m.32645 type:complete len:304 (-) Transcript_12743:703-1614(-)
MHCDNDAAENETCSDGTWRTTTATVVPGLRRARATEAREGGSWFWGQPGHCGPLPLRCPSPTCAGGAFFLKSRVLRTPHEIRRPEAGEFGVRRIPLTRGVSAALSPPRIGVVAASAPFGGVCCFFFFLALALEAPPAVDGRLSGVVSTAALRPFFEVLAGLAAAAPVALALAAAAASSAAAAAAAAFSSFSARFRAFLARRFMFFSMASSSGRSGGRSRACRFRMPPAATTSASSSGMSPAAYRSCFFCRFRIRRRVRYSCSRASSDMEASAALVNIHETMSSHATSWVPSESGGRSSGSGKE